jgi:hypothetical protein
VGPRHQIPSLGEFKCNEQKNQQIVRREEVRTYMEKLVGRSSAAGNIRNKQKPEKKK